MLEYKARITSLDNLMAELPNAIKDTITSSHEMQELLRGKDGKNAGRYLGKASRIDTSLTSNYYSESSSSWKTAEEGDYVYLTETSANWDKDTFYIVREHKSSTVWEVYDIKGRSPKVYLGSDNYLYVDGARQRYLKGEDGAKGERGEKGDRGEKGEPGHSPSHDELISEIEGSEKFKSLEVDVRAAKQTAIASLQEVETVGQDLVRTKGVAQASYEQSTAANKSITDLNKRSLTSDQRDEVAYLTSSLPQLTDPDGNKLQALALQRYITLSSNGKDISAYLASDALTAVLKAGITNFGKPEEKENVAINHNGSGHFGNLYFEGNQIDFRIDQKTDPYLSIGAAEADHIENFLYSARVDNTPVYVSSTTLPDRNKLPDSSAYTLQRTFSVTNEGTRITISIDSLKVETYKPQKAYLVLDGAVLDTWQGSNSTSIIRLPDGTAQADITQTPYTAKNLVYERTVAKGTHMVQIILETPNSSDKVTLSGFKVRQRYDTGLQQSLLTKSGLRLYGSPQRYLDVDYRQRYFQEPISGGTNTRPAAWVDNDYTVRIKGGAQVDKLTADEIDMPGVPLCGATFNENGYQIKAFGKYAKRQGQNVAQAVYYSSGNFYRVFHSIGHTRYMPTLQIVDDNGNDINWNLSARIYAVNANDFAVRILTNGDRPIKHAFSFVAFKTI